MTVISRISSDGVLKTNVELDEVSFDLIKTGPAGVFAAEFDEVSLSTST